MNERVTWSYELCGNITMIQKQHYSSGRSLILEFHSDSHQGNHTGYRGIFKFLDKGMKHFFSLIFKFNYIGRCKRGEISNY